jgi:hypothetical protein
LIEHDGSTSGLRPLGPYGEGYCRQCHFIEPLDQEGRLAEHHRGASLASSKACAGSGKVPQKITPKESRKAAFRVIAPLVACHVCGRQVIVLVDGRVSGHTMAIRVLEQCKGSFQTPPDGAVYSNRGPGSRNHSQERG